jgi:hypothetical protein
MVATPGVANFSGRPPEAVSVGVAWLEACSTLAA